MNRQLAKIAAFTATAGLALGLAGCRSMSSEDEHGSTEKHPAMIAGEFNLADQVVEEGKPVTFGIKGEFPSDTHHRWFFNGLPIDADSARELGVTGYDTPNLMIKSAALDHCGFYRYQNELTREDGRIEREISTVAQLWVARPEAAVGLQQVITVYGTVIAGGGNRGACPGRYVSYAHYPARYFGNGGTACDGSNAGNAVVYYGTPFTNTGCGMNCVTIPTIPGNYTFCLFFKSPPPPGPYPLKLTIY